MSDLRTFASDVRPYPRRRDDWEGIARLTSRLLEQRSAGYPRQVELGNLTQGEAEQRLRVMGAIDSLWARILDRQQLPAMLDWHHELGAALNEMQAEAANVRDRLAQLADAKPGNRDLIADREHADALWWHLQPIAPGGPPHLWVAHDHAQWELQRRRGRTA